MTTSPVCTCVSGVLGLQGDVMSGCVAAFLSWAVNYGKQTGAAQVRANSAMVQRRSCIVSCFCLAAAHIS